MVGVEFLPFISELSLVRVWHDPLKRQELDFFNRDLSSELLLLAKFCCLFLVCCGLASDRSISTSSYPSPAFELELRCRFKACLSILEASFLKVEGKAVPSRVLESHALLRSVNTEAFVHHGDLL